MKPFTFTDNLEMRWKLSKSMPHGSIGLDFAEVQAVEDDPESQWQWWDVTLHFINSSEGTDEQIARLLRKIMVRHIDIRPVDGSAMDASHFNFEIIREEKRTRRAQSTLKIHMSLHRERPRNHRVFQVFIIGLGFVYPLLNTTQFTLAAQVSMVDHRVAPENKVNEIRPLDIDYRARDYDRMRDLMLNQLSTTVPKWDRSVPADLGTVLVETLAYSADRLSYFQDAVGTESYLDTARQRMSVRRHARLLDYKVGEGCNSRTWIFVDADDDILLPKGQVLLTRLEGYHNVAVPTRTATLERAVSGRAQIFETLHETPLYTSHNAIRIFCYQSSTYSLKKGTTQMILHGHQRLLQKGSLLMLEQVAHPDSQFTNPDRRLRHVVRLTDVELMVPPEQEDLEQPIALEDGAQPTHPKGITPPKLTVVTWGHEDALPFDLVVTSGSTVNLALARGNLVLADHGYTREHQKLPKVPDHRPYRPTLDEFELTWWVPYEHVAVSNLPAVDAVKVDPREAVPYIYLTEFNQAGDALEHEWEARHDLLFSTPYDRHFVVEIENDRQVRLRFGDGINGWRPDPGNRFEARLRTGTGLEGNVGSDTIAHMVIQISDESLTSTHEPRQPEELSLPDINNIREVRNPLPASGGQAPESLSRIRLAAPMAWQEPKRCITEEDYARMVEKHPEVSKAVAKRTWTGSWYTMFLYLDRVGGKPVDHNFQEWVLRFMEPYLLLSDQVSILQPHMVALEIVLCVEVEDGYFANQVRGELMEVLGPYVDATGKQGLFHPDRLTFGQTIYLNQVVGRALQVEGVRSVTREIFRRWGEKGTETLKQGKIEIDTLEIPMVSNDPDNPSEGSITIIMGKATASTPHDEQEIEL